MEQLQESSVQSRLMEFITQHEGPSAVAKRIGKHPQLFYNIRDKRNLPGTETLLDIWRAYPGKFDLTYIMTGQRTAEGDRPLPPAPDMAIPTTQMEMENIMLKRENQSLRENNEMLRDVVAAQLGRDVSRSGEARIKTESANRTTQLFADQSVKPRAFLPIDVRYARPAYGVFTGRRTGSNK